MKPSICRCSVLLDIWYFMLDHLILSILHVTLPIIIQRPHYIINRSDLSTLTLWFPPNRSQRPFFDKNGNAGCHLKTEFNIEGCIWTLKSCYRLKAEDLVGTVSHTCIWWNFEGGALGQIKWTLLSVQAWNIKCPVILNTNICLVSFILWKFYI